MARLSLALAAVLLIAAPAEAAKYHPSIPNPLRWFTDQPAVLSITGTDAISFSAAAAAQSYVIGLPWCFATATMLGTVIERRELRRDEVYVMAGSCLLPVLGGLLVKWALKRHPELAPAYTAIERRPSRRGPNGIPYLDANVSPEPTA